MKRALASALIIGVATLGLAGCGEETKTDTPKPAADTAKPGGDMAKPAEK